MTMRYSFLQLDVFTSLPFGGNQLAVFPDARGLSSEQMQVLTREMNFSESTFVLPPEFPGCHAKVRIFTPAIEMPMAGHPTVGTAAAMIQKGLVALPEDRTLMLQLGIGPVKVEIEPKDNGAPFVWMNHRMPEFFASPVESADVAAALGLAGDDIRADLPLEVVSTGVPFLFVPLRSLDAARRAASDASALNRLFQGTQPRMVALFTEEVVDPAAFVHTRMYAPHVAGIVEDPATGSMAAPLGAYLAKHHVLPQEVSVTFVIEQGLEMLRPSQIKVEVIRAGEAFQNIRIGGDSVMIGEGEIFWEE